jgi:putative SOS response-associated peptidase YedK
MCHAYSITIGVEAIRQIVRTLTVGLDIGNFEPSKGIYPGMLAPIIRHSGSLLELSRVVLGHANAVAGLVEGSQAESGDAD